jgi:formamidopyrimidine-DNA glycosylase
MPELPEVESFCKYMESTSLHQKISNIEVQSKTVLTKNLSSNMLQTKLRGCRFLSVKGYGKYLFAETNKGGFLVMHFGMTGYLNYYKDSDDATRFIRMQINFDNGYHLAYDDGRKLGRIYLVDDFKQFIKKKRLGIDPIREKINYYRFK